MARDLLKPARRALERKAMVCACRIEWDTEGTGDDTTDPDTGGVVRPLDDTAVIYDEFTIGDRGRSLRHESGLGGICFIGPIQATRSVGLQIAGGARLVTAPYEIMIPLDAPYPGEGAIVECTFSEFPFSDPGLVGRQWIVRNAQTGSLLPARVLIAEERIRGSD